MNDPHQSDHLIRIGDLATATGLTVRALHHYEAIGLLPATARTESGHRLYGADAVARLYRILHLRQLEMAWIESVACWTIRR